MSHYLIMDMIDESGREGDNRVYYISYYLFIQHGWGVLHSFTHLTCHKYLLIYGGVG